MLYACIHPGRGIAKAFANVIAAEGKMLFRRCGFAQFAPGTVQAFPVEEPRKLQPRRIPQTSPDKVEKFMHNNQPERRGDFQQFGFENDAAFTDEAGGVHRRPALRGRQQPSTVGTQAWLKAYRNRTAAEFRQPRCRLDNP